MGDHVVRRARPHQLDQRLEFAHGVGVAAAVAGHDDAQFIGLRHFCSGGSIWLAIGSSVRISMMLMSEHLCSAHSASVPCHSASPRVRFSHTSVGCSGEMPCSIR